MLNSRIVAFCGETFFDDCNGNYVAKPTSAAFLQDSFGVENVFACSPYKNELLSVGVSTVIAKEQFYKAPHYASTKDFCIKALFKRNFLGDYFKFCDSIIDKHEGDYFWVRTPSIGSIVFGLRALKRNQKVIHHMCADASSTWKDAKYSFIEKALGFLMSRVLRFLLSRICANKNTLNVCTGDVLEKFSSKYSSEQTVQFVDLMVKETIVDTFTPNPQSGELKLLFVGRIVEDKGIFDLINAISKSQSNTKLTVVGNGPDYDKAVSLVSKLKLDDKIEFTGQLSHSDLDPVFNEADITVIPSDNNYEGFPRVIMESWAKHKPVIVTHVGGIKAFVKDSENGLIIPRGDVVALTMAIDKAADSKFYEKLKLGAKLSSEVSTQDYWINQLKFAIKEHL